MVGGEVVVVVALVVVVVVVYHGSFFLFHSSLLCARYPKYPTMEPPNETAMATAMAVNSAMLIWNMQPHYYEF